MSIAQTVVLRHREPGYLRFDLPEVLCTPDAAEELQRELSILDGVYRVGIQKSAGKLAIRFHTAFCSFEHLIRSLLALVKKITGRTARPRKASSRAVITTGQTFTPAASRTFFSTNAQAWIKAKIEEIKETFLALRILAKRTMGERPRWIKEFMNDLLMLFLIKLHWHQILTEWLPRPWAYRYEWMATIYMIYLSVQARVQQAA